jgi:hypothetical protein
VPVVAGATDVSGGNSEACTSQNRAVLRIASLTLAGHSGTENAPFEASDAGGMICELPES